MSTTRLLLDGLRYDPPRWRASMIPDGAANPLAKVSGKYKEIGVSKGAIAQILNLKGKNPNPDPCAQFWYHCMTCAQEYEHFRYAAKRYPVVRGQIDAQKLYPVYHKLLIESMHLQLSTEHR